MKGQLLYRVEYKIVVYEMSLNLLCASFLIKANPSRSNYMVENVALRSYPYDHFKYMLMIYYWVLLGTSGVVCHGHACSRRVVYSQMSDVLIMLV